VLRPPGGPARAGERDRRSGGVDARGDCGGPWANPPPSAWDARQTVPPHCGFPRDRVVTGPDGARREALQAGKGSQTSRALSGTARSPSAQSSLRHSSISRRQRSSVSAPGMILPTWPFVAKSACASRTYGSSHSHRCGIAAGRSRLQNSERSAHRHAVSEAVREPEGRGAIPGEVSGGPGPPASSGGRVDDSKRASPSLACRRRCGPPRRSRPHGPCDRSDGDGSLARQLSYHFGPVDWIRAACLTW